MMDGVRKKIEKNWWLGVILLAVTGVYANIFKNGFFGDDFVFIRDWELVRHMENWPRMFAGELPMSVAGVFRPVRSWWYLILYQVAETKVVWYHLWSLGVHGLGSVMAGLIGREILGDWRGGVVTGLVFGLHPVQVEAVTYIAASFDSGGIVLGLGAVYCYLVARRSGKRSWQLGSHALAGLAMLGNETALVLPMWLGFYEWLKKTRLKELWRRTRWFWGLAFGYMVTRYGAVEVASRGGHISGQWEKTAMVSLKAWQRYVELAVWPREMRLLHELPGGIRVSDVPTVAREAMLAQEWGEPGVVIAGVTLATIVVWVWWGRNKTKELSLGIGWFGLGLLPVLNLIPGASLVSERYMYMSMVGWGLVVGWTATCLWQLKGRRRVPVAGGLVLLLSWYGSVSYGRNEVWRDAVTVWRVTVAQDPENMWARFKLGETYQQSGQPVAAIDQYTHVLERIPNFGWANINLGVMAYEVGEWDKAQNYWTTALEDESTRDMAEGLLAMLSKQER